VRADPTDPDGYTRLGEGYYQQGDSTAALSAWEQALALRPEDPLARSRVDLVQRDVRLQGGSRARESQHFRVSYEGQRREEIGQALLAILERAYADVGYELGAYPPYQVETILSSEAGFGASHYGILDGKIRVGLRGLTPENPLLRSVLFHEYTHALVYAMTRGNIPPPWLNEGLAVHMEGGRAAGYKQEAMRQARAGSVPPLDSSPYMHGSAAIGYLIERYGMPRIRQMLERLGEGQPFAQAFLETFQRDLATFQREFRDVLVRGY
jgi:tetratricopeptide (TPR) repeat protein